MIFLIKELDPGEAFLSLSLCSLDWTTWQRGMVLFASTKRIAERYIKVYSYLLLFCRIRLWKI